MKIEFESLEWYKEQMRMLANLINNPKMNMEALRGWISVGLPWIHGVTIPNQWEE
jgi:hypothetical protein